MSASFNGSSSRFYNNTDLPAEVSGYPFAIFAWIKPTSASTSYMVAGAGDFSGGNDEFMMYADGAGTGKLRAFARGSGSNAADSASSIVTTWQPALVVFTSTTSRTAYYAGGASGSDTNSQAPSFAALDRVTVGVRGITNSLYFAGLIAHVAMWQGTVPNSSDWTSLAAGATPSDIAAAGLIDYWALTSTQGSNQTGSVNGYVLTADSISDSADNPTLSGGGGNRGRLIGGKLARSILTRGLAP